MQALVATDVFAILADPTRRHLVEVLHDGERSVGDLVASVDIEQPGVSRHLRILHRAGLVTVRPSAQKRLYSLSPDALSGLEAWVRQYAQEQGARLQRLAHLVEEPKRARTKGRKP